MKKLALIILLFSYAVPGFGEANFPDKVIWGMYCGECIGNCSTMREITNNKLSIDKSNNYLISDPYKFNYKFKGVPEPSAEFEKYKWILNKSVPGILSKSTMIFGQPDAYDQCGYYLMFSVNSSQYEAIIDAHKVPKELEPLIKKLFHGTL